MSEPFLAEVRIVGFNFAPRGWAFCDGQILPINQNVDYYFPISKSFFEGAVLLGFCVWSSLVASIFLLRRKFPLIAFGIGWILITLLVESSILPIRDVINEYRLYLPMVGFSAIVSFTLFRFMPKLISKDGTLFVAALLLLTYAGLTFNRNFSYKDDLTFWLDASAKSPQKARPYVNSAVQYHLKGDWQNAVKQYDKALEIDPERLTALANKGVIYTQLKQFDQAKTYFNRALEIDNEYLDALNGLGVVSLNSNELDQAEELFNRVLSIEPTNNAALENLILVENAKGS